MHSMPWIDVNHKKEDAGRQSVVKETHLFQTLEVKCQRMSDHFSNVRC